MKTTPYNTRFILHCGEMGSRWGMNRTVGQIWALLILSEQPRNADQIVAALGMSRSNVSLGLKELQAWNLIRLQHLPGDRKDYFSAPDDIWTLFQTLAEQRRKREIDPTVALLRDALSESVDDGDDDYARRRMREMLELVELMTDWFADVQRLERATLVRLLRLGGGIGRLLDLAGRRRPPDDTGTPADKEAGAADPSPTNDTRDISS